MGAGKGDGPGKRGAPGDEQEEYRPIPALGDSLSGGLGYHLVPQVEPVPHSLLLCTLRGIRKGISSETTAKNGCLLV